MVAAQFALVILFIAFAGQADANCLPVNTASAVAMQATPDYADMDTAINSKEDRSPSQSPGPDTPEMCHLGCMTLFAATEGSGPYPGFTGQSYATGRQSSPTGIGSIPQTPPPRFG